MIGIRKLLQRASVLSESPDTEMHSSLIPTLPATVEGEYQAIILGQLERGGINPRTVTLELMQAGRTASGRQVFLGMLRLCAWDRSSALRLLLGLPLLEAKVQQAVRATWLPEVSHFGGLWLHPSAQVQSTPALTDLRGCIQHLEALQGAGTQPDSLWSMPAFDETGQETVVPLQTQDRPA